MSLSFELGEFLNSVRVGLSRTVGDPRNGGKIGWHRSFLLDSMGSKNRCSLVKNESQGT